LARIRLSGQPFSSTKPRYVPYGMRIPFAGHWMPVRTANSSWRSILHLPVRFVLARVDEGAVQALGEEDISFTFPAIVSGKAKTRLVLKKPKTESSIRKVWIPAPLVKLLLQLQGNPELAALLKGLINANMF